MATATCFLGPTARYRWPVEQSPDTHCLRRTPASCMSLQPNALRSSSSSGGMPSSRDGVHSIWASVASGTRPGAAIKCCEQSGRGSQSRPNKSVERGCTSHATTPAMSTLPSKPEFSRTAATWPESGDERRPSGPGRASPDRYPSQRDDRDRDRDARDRERGNRSRYGHRSPHPPRSTDTYFAGSRDTFHGREYRGYDDARPRDDRRKDWDRDRDRDRDRDMDRDRDRDRDRGYYRRQRVDDIWPPRKDYSPNRPPLGRRGYAPRDSDRRGRDDYRREKDRERGRSWDRDDQRPRDRDYDRRPASPTYRPTPLSPRRGESITIHMDTHLDNLTLDHHREHHSSPRRAPPLYPSRGRRSVSPQSIGSRSRRSSPLSRARPEPAYTHPSRDIPQAPRSRSPRRESHSPRRHSRPVSSPPRERQSPETAGRQPYHPDEPHREVGTSGSEPVRVEDRPAGDATVLEGETDAKRTTEALDKGKERSDNQDGETEPAGMPGSPMGCQPESIPTIETVAMASSEVAVTQPYLPTIPRYEAKPRFSVAYESEASLFDVSALTDSSRLFLLV